MTSKEALKIARVIVRKLFENDVEAIAYLMAGEAKRNETFLKDRIIELKNICELSLEELENGN